ncbi:DUF488 domain-containing protein [Streptomyces sp. WZ-12]|uniref:DUF488 domain-containing protein n=1 Tax=Streptomyces sp. WZ-12 TaxID=3030210 RepID=UPI00406C7230
MSGTERESRAPRTSPAGSADQTAAATPRGVRTESVYGPARPWPGTRVLVDRRLTLARLPLIVRPDIWLARVAPSATLWRWYALNEVNYRAFARRYAQELAEDPPRADALRRLHQLARTGPLILQTAATPLHLSHARVLAHQLATDAPGRPPEDAGDAACWLRTVCPHCDRIPDQPMSACPSCGMPLPGPGEG